MRCWRIARGAELGEIGPHTECATGRTQANFANRIIRGGKREAVEQRIAHRPVDRIVRVRAIEREAQAGAFASDADRARLRRIVSLVAEPRAMLCPALERGEGERFGHERGLGCDPPGGAEQVHQRGGSQRIALDRPGERGQRKVLLDHHVGVRGLRVRGRTKRDHRHRRQRVECAVHRPSGKVDPQPRAPVSAPVGVQHPRFEAHLVHRCRRCAATPGRASIDQPKSDQSVPPMDRPGMTRAGSNDGGIALAHARELLAALGIEGDPRPPGEHPALAWRRSGLMAVTGRDDGPGLVCPAPLTAAADGALAALAALAPGAALPASGAALLGERARLLGLSRRGSTSPNGTCRLLPTRDGKIALNLAREDDWTLLPALFESDEAEGWLAVERLCGDRSSGELRERGALLGLALAVEGETPAPRTPFAIERLGSPRSSARLPLVVDLSSLWAGPLAGSLLAMTGARVVKVESLRRPDGARLGSPEFYRLLNGMKEVIELDFASSAGIDRLRGLVAEADIVIESSRPRALAQFGIDARAAAAAGATWVSLTAHGREGEAGNRIGFGDDAAVAAGLSAAMRAGWGESLFAGDAIADPLTGITAAFAAFATWRGGGGALVGVSLAGTVAHALTLPQASEAELREWQAMAKADTAPLHPLREAA